MLYEVITAEVYCIMTEETKDIVGKYALEFGCGNEVMDKITGKIEHVSLYNDCDLMIIFPATANIISKISLNIADRITSYNVCYTKLLRVRRVFSGESVE